MDDLLSRLLTGLEIMGKGMGGIFVVIIVITLLVVLMNKITEIVNNKKQKP